MKCIIEIDDELKVGKKCICTDKSGKKTEGKIISANIDEVLNALKCAEADGKFFKSVFYDYNTTVEALLDCGSKVFVSKMKECSPKIGEEWEYVDEDIKCIILKEWENDAYDVLFNDGGTCCIPRFELIKRTGRVFQDIVDRINQYVKMDR